VKTDWFNQGFACVEGNMKFAIANTKNYEVIKKSNCISVVYDFVLGAFSKKPYINGKLTYSLYDDGTLNIKMSGNLRKLGVWLSRLGFEWDIDNSFNKVRYFGYGPYESYVDKHYGSQMGVFEKYADEFFVNYLKPQESGSVYNTKWSILKSVDGSIAFAGDCYSFNVSEYSIDQLIEKRHSYELIKEDTLKVYTDYFMSGVGSAACGPKIDEKYTLNGELDIEFNITLFINNGSDNGFKLLHKHNGIK
jgi:beta-galactosidase